MRNGRTNMTEAELVAILLGSGNRDESAVELARRIMRETDHQLDQLGRLSVQELMRFKGVGEAKAITIVAALELGRRRMQSNPKHRSTILTSQQAYAYFRPILTDLQYEEFWILLLNRASKVIARNLIGRGGIDSTVADRRLIFKHALDHMATSIILCHNHPSGSTAPSKHDLALTEKLVKAGKFMDIHVVDHIIIGEGGYYSFADEGLIKVKR